MLWSLRSQSATVIDRWLWPTFVFLSLSWFLPGGVNTWASSVAARQWILGTFVATGLIFELLRGAKSSISLRPLVVTHVPPVLALAFGGWTLVASRESDYQIESLTGSLRYGDSGALWYVGLSLAFVATYFNVRRVSGGERRIAGAVAIAGVFLSVIALVEVFLGRSLIIASDVVPVATFMGPGHLASALVLAIGAIMGFATSRTRAAFAACLLVATALGATGNRAGPIAVLLVAIAVAIMSRPKRTRVLALATAIVVGLTLGNVLAIQSNGHVTQVQRTTTDTTSLTTRILLSKAAINAIKSRPVFGFGGGDAFSAEWYTFLSPVDLGQFLELDHGFDRLEGIIDEGGGPPIFLNRRQSGEIQLHTIFNQKVHNQYLDVAVMWGLLGLALYVLTLLPALPNVMRLQPAALAIATSSVFLIVWFSMFQLEGAFWVCLAAACAGRPSAVVAGRDSNSGTEALAETQL